MTKVYDSKGNEIGQFDGRFVYGSIGEKCYWINDEDVFSMPPINRENELGGRANIWIANLSGKVAIDLEGATLFTL